MSSGVMVGPSFGDGMLRTASKSARRSSMPIQGSVFSAVFLKDGVKCKDSPESLIASETDDRTVRIFKYHDGPEPPSEETPVQLQGPLRLPLSDLPAFHTKYDEYISRHYSHYRWTTTSEENLKTYFRWLGATDDTLEEYLEEFNNEWNEMVASLPDGRLRIVGEKPKLGEDEHVSYFPIPDSEFAIRIWPGGMQDHGQFCLDYFDIKHRVPVNVPEGFELWDIPRPGVFSFGGKHISWEAAFRMSDVPPGEEKFSLPEGSRVALTRSGKDHFYFEIPSRPIHHHAGVSFAQPQALPL